jgi:Restriction endonuclease
MSSGYVLDFTNSTYAAFFRNDVGLDIYDDVYAYYGDSKGKRLRRFLEVGQPVAVSKALAALWEYRETSRIDHRETETIPNARARLSSLIVRLGGTPLPSDPAVEHPPASTKPALPSETTLAALDAEFLALTQMDEQPQQHGRAFERFLKRWFDAWGLDAHASFTTRSEEIDGSFQHEGATYIVEAKWHNKPVNGAMLHGFQGKLLERPDWTRGLYVSYGGYSAESFDAFTARRIIMMDGTDIYYALNRRLDLGRVIAMKARYHAERRQPFARVTDLFAG